MKIPKEKYSLWTDEQKAEYKEYKASLEQRKVDASLALFEKLETELQAIELDASKQKIIFDIIAQLKPASTKVVRKTYMSVIFGTEKPEVGTEIKYSAIMFPKLPNGEIDVDNVKSAKDISDMLWYLARRGFVIHNDKIAKTISFVGKTEEQVEKPLVTELIKKKKSA
jgi:hypothetical protein